MSDVFRGEIRLGVIYKLTSPSGKSYIGQTVRTLLERWFDHIRAARREYPGCIAIAYAIKKYGSEGFKIEVLVTCPIDKLDEEEIRLIYEHKTLYPDGYNLTRGGQGLLAAGLSEYTKDKISKSLRKNVNDLYDPPRYIQYVPENETKSEGYVVDIPNKRFAAFCCSDMSLDEKYHFAIRFLIEKEASKEILDEYNKLKQSRRRKKIAKIVIINGETFELPCYISYSKRDNGFIARKPGYHEIPFKDRTLSMRENFNMAITYLDRLD